MNDVWPHCPDCSVEMERMTLMAEGSRLQAFSDESRDGLLGSLGAKQRFELFSFVCPECGLIRQYANLDE